VINPPTANQVLLRCEHVDVRRGDLEVVRDVSLELRRGELVALLGPNGAGKSTLLDALAGALPHAQGRIERHGRVAIALQAPDLARRSVLANVSLALAWWGVPRPERADRAREALATMGGEHLARRAAATLSGGERRRVHLARALAVRPDILMLDEPFAGLDAEARGRLLEDAVSILRSGDRATLVVVHDRAEAWALADRLLILIDGQLVAEGPPRELLEHPPSPVVARFLGFDGSLEDDGETLLTRPPHVRLDPAGPLRARVTRAVALEDGFRLELELAHGRLYTVAPVPAPRLGDTVRVSVVGGARFPLGSPDDGPDRLRGRTEAPPNRASRSGDGRAGGPAGAQPIARRE
jgi:ABC-type multidrug transport system ATPase subunit